MEGTTNIKLTESLLSSKLQQVFSTAARLQMLRGEDASLPL